MTPRRKTAKQVKPTTFDNTKDDPSMAWRIPYISYYVLKALDGIVEGGEAADVVDLGCNDGRLLKYVDDIRSIDSYGVDRVLYPGQPRNFYHCSVQSWIGTNDKFFDVAICSWILVHLSHGPDDVFWGKLSSLARYLITFENEDCSYNKGRDFTSLISMKCELSETILISETKQTLRIFKHV